MNISLIMTKMRAGGKSARKSNKYKNEYNLRFVAITGGIVSSIQRNVCLNPENNYLSIQNIFPFIQI